VPCQQRARRDQAMAAQPGWQQPGQRGQDSPVGPVRPGSGDLAAQDCDFVAEHHDLGVFRRLAAAQQEQPAKDAGHDEVEKSNRHSPRSCLITVSGPNRSSRPPHRVLERYTQISVQSLPGCTAAFVRVPRPIAASDRLFFSPAASPPSGWPTYCAAGGTTTTSATLRAVTVDAVGQVPADSRAHGPNQTRPKSFAPLRDLNSATRSCMGLRQPASCLT
jgi:hypothetical protein